MRLDKEVKDVICTCKTGVGRGCKEAKCVCKMITLNYVIKGRGQERVAPKECDKNIDSKKLCGQLYRTTSLVKESLLDISRRETYHGKSNHVDV